MRFTQYIGLNSHARSFVGQSNSERLRNSPISFGYYEIDGATTTPLDVYFDKEKQKLIFEKVEVEPWSSGPNIYTFLVYEDGEPIVESYWAVKDGSNYVVTDDDDEDVWMSDREPNSWTSNDGQVFLCNGEEVEVPTLFAL